MWTVGARRARRSQGRDLLRRRLAMAILVALPLAFYLSMLGDPDTLFALVAGAVEFGVRRGRKVVNIVPAGE